MKSKWTESIRKQFAEKHKDIDIPYNTQTLILDYFEAMAMFYGTIPLKKVYEILTDEYNEDISETDFYEFTDVIHNDPIDHYYIDSEEESFDQEKTSMPEDRLLVHESIVVVDMDIYSNISKLKRNKPYYVPEKDEMLRYGDEFYYEETEQIMELRRFFIRRLGTEQGLDIAEEVALHIRMEDVSFDDTLNDIQRMGWDMSTSEIKEFIPYYIALNNNTRLAANNGYTPAEIEALFKDSDVKADSLFINNIEFDEEHDKERRSSNTDTLRELKQMTGIMRMFAKAQGTPFPELPVKKPKKIGRNDPCPCGSGKKFKKCCGR